MHPDAVVVTVRRTGRRRRRRARTSARVACACRATLESASRSTGSSWSRSASVTAVSTGPLVRTVGEKPEDRARTPHERAESPIAASPAARVCSSKIVARMSRIVHVEVASTARSMRSRTSPVRSPDATRLQLHAGREEPLDHHVVQVPGDPLPVGDDGELLTVLDRLCPVERERGMVGEADVSSSRSSTSRRSSSRRVEQGDQEAGSARRARSGTTVALRSPTVDVDRVAERGAPEPRERRTRRPPDRARDVPRLGRRALAPGRRGRHGRGPGQGHPSRCPGDLLERASHSIGG